MSRKKREIRAELARTGFTNRGGKGDHTVWVHPLVPQHVSVDGKDSDDAKPYDERNLRRALRDLEQAQQQRQQKPGRQGKRS